MAESVDLRIFFNFRSPYCYLASKTMFTLLDDYNANLVWRPANFDIDDFVGPDGETPEEGDDSDGQSQESCPFHVAGLL